MRTGLLLAFCVCLACESTSLASPPSGNNPLSNQAAREDWVYPAYAGTKGLDAFLGRPIDPAGNRKGYVMTLGFGPGGSSTAASVFSPGEEYKVQVLLSRGESTRVTQDLFGLTSKIALETLSILFGSKQ
jgi:hypothetical protein